MKNNRLFTLSSPFMICTLSSISPIIPPPLLPLILYLPVHRVRLAARLLLSLHGNFGKCEFTNVYSIQPGEFFAVHKLPYLGAIVTVMFPYRTVYCIHGMGRLGSLSDYRFSAVVVRARP